MKKQQGLSLVELLMVTAVVGGIVVFIGVSLKSAMNGQSSFLAKSDVKTAIVNLSQSIAQVGRLAHECTLTAGPTKLECRVDTNNPPTTADDTDPIASSDDSLYSFEYRKNSTNCNQTAQTNCVVATITRGAEARETFYQLGADLSQTSPFADHLVICSDNEFNSDTCAIKPSSINAEHKLNLANEPATFGNRFFRFAILATDPDYEDARPFILQSAFFRRNPVPSFDFELRYQWGSKS